MLILVPAPLTKRARDDGEPVDLAALSFPELTDARLAVLDAVGETGLLVAPTTPARELYAGVLMDSLLQDLPAAALARLDEQLVYLTGNWGAVRPTDDLPASRDSMHRSPHGIGLLVSYWGRHLDAVLSPLADEGMIVDLRASDYLAAWRPSDELSDRWLKVKVVQDNRFDRGSSGGAVSRRTRGLVARRILLDGMDAQDPTDMADALAPHFRVQLRPPDKHGPTELRVLQQ